MTLRAHLNIPPPTDPHDFDGKVEDALRARHRNIHLVRYASPGKRQSGIDGWDPLSNGGGIVWQATLTSDHSKLRRKLAADLMKMDKAGIDPEQFIYAVGVTPDGGIQDEVAALSAQREEDGRCSVEVLFWNQVRQFILDDDRLFKKHFSTLIPLADGGQSVASAVLKPAPPSLVAIEAASVCPDDDDPHRCLWQMLHLARMCDEQSDPVTEELEGALLAADAGARDFKYWAVGTIARGSGGTWYYPNSMMARSSGRAWYYPNSTMARSSGGAWYYPNSMVARASSGTWYAPDGMTA